MEDEACDKLTSVEVRHRKEKKELQAHITALKKTAKNDKTKKKELTAEISRLEAEQEVRHKDELEALQNSSAAPSEPSMDIQNSLEEVENDLPKLKISKAQKRRDKKHKEEKEREEQIKLQEKENINGPRNLETQALSEKLKNMNIKIYPIPSDGDCLYKAVAHQLQTKREKTFTVDELRKNVADYIRKHKDDFIPFMSHPDSCEMLSEVEFENYCDKICNTKVWGGQLEIRALSNLLHCPINVVQATGPNCIEQGMEFEGPPLIISYHRHMYSLGEHYNSTCPETDA